MSSNLVKTVALVTLFAAAVGLAVASFPRTAEAEMCLPETQVRERKVGEGSCCSSDPPARTWYYFKEERYRNPDCSWTRWYYIERTSKCIAPDYSCNPIV